MLARLYPHADTLHSVLLQLAGDGAAQLSTALQRSTDAHLALLLSRAFVCSAGPLPGPTAGTASWSAGPISCSLEEVGWAGRTSLVQHPRHSRPAAPARLLTTPALPATASPAHAARRWSIGP